MRTTASLNQKQRGNTMKKLLRLLVRYLKNILGLSDSQIVDIIEYITQ